MSKDNETQSVVILLLDRAEEPKFDPAKWGDFFKGLGSLVTSVAKLIAALLCLLQVF
jgi:hypothetical protein